MDSCKTSAARAENRWLCPGLLCLRYPGRALAPGEVIRVMPFLRRCSAWSPADALSLMPRAQPVSSTWTRSRNLPLRPSRAIVTVICGSGSARPECQIERDLAHRFIVQCRKFPPFCRSIDDRALVADALVAAERRVKRGSREN